MSRKKAADYIHEWMQADCMIKDYELSRVEFIKEADNWYLRVYVDKIADGEYTAMGTDDCERISRYLSEKLDEEDPIKQNYYLEVSSPGLDRLLVSEKDFERFSGEMVDIKLFRPLDGKKFLQGRLVDLENGMITISDDSDNKTSVPREQASKISLTIIF